MQQDPLPKKSAQPSLVIAHCKYCITLQRVRKVIGFNKLGWKGLRMGCIAGAKGCGWTFGILVKTSAGSPNLTGLSGKIRHDENISCKMAIFQVRYVLHQ